ncbi:hypothetical protein, partial [Roseibium sp.]|uniref:hypothetical protein n=1 Tax=Roseibium sp. TaxID=1936156 RepID=UPI001B201788
SSGTSAQADITGPSLYEGLAWEVIVESGAVWVKAGANPTAAVGDDTKILAGERIYLSVAMASEKLAVIDHA